MEKKDLEIYMPRITEISDGYYLQIRLGKGVILSEDQKTISADIYFLYKTIDDHLVVMAEGHLPADFGDNVFHVLDLGKEEQAKKECYEHLDDFVFSVWNRSAENYLEKKEN